MDWTNVVELFGAIVAGFAAGAIAMSRSRCTNNPQVESCCLKCGALGGIRAGISHQKMTGHCVLFEQRIAGSPTGGIQW